MSRITQEQKEMLLEIAEEIKCTFPDALSVCFDGDCISVEFIDDYERDGELKLTAIGTSKYELRFLDGLEE